MNKNIYLFLGPENGEKKEFIKKIKKNKTEKYGDLENFRFYPYDTEIIEIVSIMKNGSLFSSHKLVIINNCEDIKKKNAIEQLVTYCKSPSKDVTLILLSDNNKVDSKIEKVIPAAQKKIFWEMFENKKKGWVISFFRKKNIIIRSSTVELFLEMVENDTDSMKKECEKLAFYFNEGDTIRKRKILHL